MIKAELSLRRPDEKLREALVKALTPETRIALRGVKASISEEGDSVRIVIEAPDHSSFRATINSLLRLMEATERMLQNLPRQSNT